MKDFSFAHLQETYPWAKSIVICISQYGKYHIPEHLQGLIGKAYLVDSRRDEQSKELKVCAFTVVKNVNLISLKFPYPQ